MKKIIKIIFIVMISNSAFAYQSKSAVDNETLMFDISKKEYSKIYVNNDRILSVKGQNYLYEIENFKSKEGELYIRPTKYAKDTFSLFITTEKGHKFALQLRLKEILAENIEIKPLTIIRNTNQGSAKNNHYTISLINLLKVMVNLETSQDYSITEFDEIKMIPINNGLDMKLLRLYKGKDLEGEIWLVKNRTRKKLLLNAQDFYKEKIKAISIASNEIGPREATLLYRIF